MKYPELQAEIDRRIAELTAEPKIPEDTVAWYTAKYFWTKGEWPTPHEVWNMIAEPGSLFDEPITLEEARQACIEACDNGEVYGLHTVVAMRHGEVRGDWLAPLGDEDPWRLAVPAGMMMALGNSPHFARMIARTQAA